MNDSCFLNVVVPSPAWSGFDYLPPKNIDIKTLQPGMRVTVPFGRRSVVGVIKQIKSSTDVPANKLRAVSDMLDEEPLFTSTLLKLCEWASDYYHHPLSEVLLGTLPKMLRDGKTQKPELSYQITDAGRAAITEQTQRAPKQKSCLEILKAGAQSESALKSQGFSKTILNALLEKRWIEPGPLIKSKKPAQPININDPKLALNAAQQDALTQIHQSTSFKPFLLMGVTGSGKTEVYLQAITPLLQEQKQILLLVPEIALTPQTVQRFQKRFDCDIVMIHSELSDGERMQAWLKAASGEARIIIGTRSAIFVPLKNPGMIILDEEHDASFKQHSGFRYSARDLAIVRAQLEKTPVILGSATPSLESLQNVITKKYQLLRLPERAGNAKPPKIELVDLRRLQLVGGMSAQLLETMRQHLDNQGQVLLFLNRRGYAPVMMCHECGEILNCNRCDARMILHQNPQRLICHHCEWVTSLPNQCPACHSDQIVTVGLGTERLEVELRQRFKDKTILRIDRDTARGKSAIQNLLQSAQDNADILIGTQMLAKGHHFPNLTLVVIVDADGGLYSVDFRALEHLGQLLVQVAGRAGREEKAGEVIIQTHHPDHPLLQILLREGYTQFAKAVLRERQLAMLPPHAHLALLRAESTTFETPSQFLQMIKDVLTPELQQTVQLLGPIPAPMHKKAGRFRSQLLLQSPQRQALQKTLHVLRDHLKQQKKSKDLRWSLDVDPIDMS